MKIKPKLMLLLFTVISINTFSQTIPSYVPANGLVAWYPFTGNAVDSSGNVDNNGTIHGATLTTDRFGNTNSAYHFDGIANYIGGSCSNLPTGVRTVSLWFNATNIGATRGNGVFGYGGETCGESWIQSIYSGLFGLGMHCNINDAIYSTFVQNNAWHHWLITNDSISKTKFYIDGQHIFDTSHFYVTNVTGKDLIIGGISSPSGTGGLYTDVNISAFEGDIDDVGIWNRVLTPCEITQLFNADILSVTVDPVNYTAGITDTALFYVVSPTANANFQWQTDSAGSGFHNIDDGALYNGTTNDTLWINNVTPDNNQLFRCIVSLPFYCADTSAVASLIITGTTPVTLLNFNATRHGKIVYLNWASVNESNLGSYSIERSTDGNHFYSIGNIKASNNIIKYSYDFNDTIPFAGLNFYRLKINETDGRYSYSSVQKIDFQNNNSIKFYPNPSTGKFTIDLGKLFGSKNKTIVIRDVLGQKIYQYDTDKQIFEINIKSKTKPGFYFLQVFDANNLKIAVQKLVIK